MSILVDTHISLEAFQLRDICRISEALDERQGTEDSRVYIDHACIVVDKIDTGLAISLLGERHPGTVGCTVTAADWNTVIENVWRVLCSNFKVGLDEPPF